MSFFLSPSSAAKRTCFLYEQIAEDFSKTREKMEWGELEHFAKQTKNGSQILDVGCGNGRLMDILEIKKRNISYTGVDPSMSLLEIAQKKDVDARCVKADFSLLPFRDESFEEVWAIASFHHLPTEKDRKIALREVFRVLKGGGSLVMTVWNHFDQPRYASEKQKAVLRAYASPLWSDRDFLVPWGKKKQLRYYFSFSPEHLRDLLEGEGFFVEECFFSEGRKNICVRARKGKKNNIRVHMFGIPIDRLSLEETLCVMEKRKHQRCFIATPNPEMFVQAEKNASFQKILASADVSLPDGVGLLWASGISFLRGKRGLWLWTLGIFSLFFFAFFRKYFSRTIQKTVCGSDIFRAFLEHAEQKKQKNIFLVGGAKGSASLLADRFSHAIVGIEDGEISSDHSSELCEKITNSGAEILFVALGAPKQEFWIAKNLPFLPHIRLAMGVGGSFDFAAGMQKRAPLFLRKAGIEWLWRLFREPKRIRRIWNAVVKFPLMVIGKT